MMLKREYGHSYFISCGILGLKNIIIVGIFQTVFYYLQYVLLWHFFSKQIITMLNEYRFVLAIIYKQFFFGPSYYSVYVLP